MGKYLVLIEDPKGLFDGERPRDTAAIILGDIEDGEGSDCEVSVRVYSPEQVVLLADGVALLDNVDASRLEIDLKEIVA